MCSTALICLLALALHSLPSSWESDWFNGRSLSFCSGPKCTGLWASTSCLLNDTSLSSDPGYFPSPPIIRPRVYDPSSLCPSWLRTGVPVSCPIPIKPFTLPPRCQWGRRQIVVYARETSKMDINSALFRPPSRAAIDPGSQRENHPHIPPPPAVTHHRPHCCHGRRRRCHSRHRYRHRCHSRDILPWSSSSLLLFWSQKGGCFRRFLFLFELVVIFSSRDKEIYDLRGWRTKKRKGKRRRRTKGKKEEEGQEGGFGKVVTYPPVDFILES